MQKNNAILTYERVDKSQIKIKIASTLWINLPYSKFLVSEYSESGSPLLKVKERDNNIQVTLKNK